MIYGKSYEGKQRDCTACGHFTNVHANCAHCNGAYCENCEDREGFCSPACHQAKCEHLHMRYEEILDVHEEAGYWGVIETWTCRDCGAEIDEDGEVIAERRAA